MKRLVSACIVAGLVFVAAGNLSAQAGTPAIDGTEVANTPHNLGDWEVVTGAHTRADVYDLGGVCVYCHYPHNASTSAPLWNRADPGGPYNMYDSPTIDMTIAGAPQAVSLACLSCHDGTVALDAVSNVPLGVTGYASTGNAITYCTTGCHNGTGGEPDFRGGNVGTDLSDDHPISVTYDPTQDTDFQSIANAQTAGAVFYGTGVDQVECGSCHNPHTEGNRPFLRVSNADSNLCYACHIK